MHVTVVTSPPRFALVLSAGRRGGFVHAGWTHGERLATSPNDPLIPVPSVISVVNPSVCHGCGELRVGGAVVRRALRMPAAACANSDLTSALRAGPLRPAERRAG